MSRQESGDDNSEHPILKLPPNRQEELITAWEDYASDNDTTNVRRRGFLQAGAALLTGTAIGGGAYALSSEEVAAAANEVGQIGEPGNLVDVYGEDVSAVSVDTERSNNTYHIDENDDPQTVIDDLKTDYGSGVAELLPGVHTFNDVQVRNGITLKGPSPDHFSGDHAEVQPDGDVPAVRIDHDGGVAQVEDVWFNADPVAGYSSRLLLVPSGLVPFRVADNCAFEGPGSGTGIGWDDTAGSDNIGTVNQGIGPGWVSDCRFDSLGDAITTTFGTGYVSRPGHLDSYWVDCARIANEDHGSGGGKYTGVI